MSTARLLIERIRDDLEGINGPTGRYTHDIGERCFVGDPGAQAVDGLLPAVWITRWTITSRDDDQLGAYRRVLAVQILGVVGDADANDADVEGPGGRALSATDLLDDIATCLERDRTLGGRVVRMILDGQALDGAELGQPTIGACEVALIVEYIAPSEVGV